MDDKRWEVSAAARKAFEWDKWCKEIPELNFKPEWGVQIIPPVVGAVVRFVVSHSQIPGSRVSVYLDCYDMLGCMNMKPHWEIYPDTEDNNLRFFMHETKELLDEIEQSLQAQRKKRAA